MTPITLIPAADRFMRAMPLAGHRRILRVAADAALPNHLAVAVARALEAEHFIGGLRWHTETWWPASIRSGDQAVRLTDAGRQWLANAE